MTNRNIKALKEQANNKCTGKKDMTRGKRNDKGKSKGNGQGKKVKKRRGKGSDKEKGKDEMLERFILDYQRL